MNFLVYSFRHPNEPLPFYIGKGKPNRPAAHFKLRKILKSHFYAKLNAILDCGQMPIIEIIADGLTERQAFDLEINLIKIYGRRDRGTGCLCNHTDGGEGNSGGWSRTGIPHTLETRIKMSKPMRPEGRANVKRVAQSRATPIESFDLVTNETIDQYPSQAAVKNHGYNQPNVAACLAGRRTEAHGRGWRYQ